MTETAHPINLNLAQKLRNREYRQKFFLAESSAHIAEQLIALRKRRGLDQTQLAERIGTQQPAISRVEKADYQNWSFNTLRKIADAEDARIRVSIEPAEDILKEYETVLAEQPIDREFVTVITNQMAGERPAHQNLYVNPWQVNEGTNAMDYRHPPRPQGVVGFSSALMGTPLSVWSVGLPYTTNVVMWHENAELRENTELRRENANLKEENARLRLRNLLSAAQEGAADVARAHTWFCTQQMPSIPRVAGQEQ